jgi:hypothetical protein
MPPSSRPTAGAVFDGYSAEHRAANVRDARNNPVVDDFIPAGLVAEVPTRDDYIVEPAVAKA